MNKLKMRNGSTIAIPSHFALLKQYLERMPGNETLTYNLETWMQGGEWIAGYTKESPGKNLAAWAVAQGYRVALDEPMSQIRFAKIQNPAFN